jgi:transcriptional regulator with XRE-family HTH domain
MSAAAPALAGPSPDACDQGQYAAGMARDPVDRWRDLGSFIREQRSTARLSLRRLSELAGISNPYLSQIERGLRRPSADILQQLAKALRISAETLYVQAGILDPPADTPDLVRQILADRHIGESQKQALVEIYLSFRRAHETDRADGQRTDEPSDGSEPNHPEPGGHDFPGDEGDVLAGGAPGHGGGPGAAH